MVKKIHRDIRTLATKWVVLTEPIITLLAVIAARAFNVGFAPALSCDQPHVQISVAITHTSLQRSHRITITGYN